MGNQKKYVCPWGGGKDVVEGIQGAYATVQLNKNLTFKVKRLVHVFRKACG